MPSNRLRRFEMSTETFRLFHTEVTARYGQVVADAYLGPLTTTSRYLPITLQDRQQSIQQCTCAHCKTSIRHSPHHAYTHQGELSFYLCDNCKP